MIIEGYILEMKDRRILKNLRGKRQMNRGKKVKKPNDAYDNLDKNLAQLKKHFNDFRLKLIPIYTEQKQDIEELEQRLKKIEDTLKSYHLWDD